jgi:hypothetical protein
VEWGRPERSAPFFMVIALGGCPRMTGGVLEMMEGRRLRSGHCYFSVRVNFHSLNCISVISVISTSENRPEFVKLRT